MVPRRQSGGLCASCRLETSRPMPSCVRWELRLSSSSRCCNNMLTWIICLPFAAALLTALVPRNYRFVIRVISLAATLISMLLALKLFWDFDAADVVNGYRFHQARQWVDALKISYHVGVDGINLGLVVMGAIVAFAAACVPWEIKAYE